MFKIDQVVEVVERGLTGFLALLSGSNPVEELAAWDKHRADVKACPELFAEAIKARKESLRARRIANWISSN